MSEKVHIVEVGLRDGLQNESQILNLSARLSLAEKLCAAGLKRIELGAFVSPTWVPQMANTGKLIKKCLQLQKKGLLPADVMFSALVPNERGMRDALDSGVPEIAVFSAVSETFSQKNTNCSFKESLERFQPVLKLAEENNIRVRGYLSTVFGCPYEGEISEDRVVDCARAMMDLGIYELSLGDTIGVANPKQVRSLLPKLLKTIAVENVALHMHDTRGLSLANILAGVDLGVRSFDASVGGLGGCPYAPGASGNVATEDVVYLLESMGYDSGIDLKRLVAMNRWVSDRIQHDLPSRVGKAGLFVSGS